MKKITSIFCALILLSSQSQAASGFFIGADYLNTNAIHTADNNSLSSGSKDGDKKTAANHGYGVNAGIRFDPLFLFASAEIFYERLNSSSKSFNQISAGQDIKIDLNERYGAKGNLGVTVLPWLTPFLTYGIARVKYGTDQSSWKEAPLYGAGIIFDIPLTNFSVKAAYDVQQIKFPYQTGQSKTSLGVARVGVTYTF